MIRLPACSVVISSPARLRPSRISLPFHRCRLTVCDHGWWSQCPFIFLSANHWLSPCRSIEPSADDDPFVSVFNTTLGTHHRAVRAERRNESLTCRQSSTAEYLLA